MVTGDAARGQAGAGHVVGLAVLEQARSDRRLPAAVGRHAAIRGVEAVVDGRERQLVAVLGDTAEEGRLGVRTQVVERGTRGCRTVVPSGRAELVGAVRREDDAAGVPEGERDGDRDRGQRRQARVIGRAVGVTDVAPVFLVGIIVGIEGAGPLVGRDGLAAILALEERVEVLRGVVVGDRDGLRVLPRRPVVEHLREHLGGRWRCREGHAARRQQAALFQDAVANPAPQHARGGDGRTHGNAIAY